MQKYSSSGGRLAVGVAGALSVAAVMAPAALAGETSSVSVSGAADIFGAGLAQVPAPAGNPGAGTGGGTLPPMVKVTASPGEVLTVPTVTGSV